MDDIGFSNDNEHVIELSAISRNWQVLKINIILIKIQHTYIYMYICTNLPWYVLPHTCNISLGRYCIFSLSPGFVFGTSAQACFFSFRLSTSSVELCPWPKLTIQAGANDLNTIMVQYLYGALLRAIAERTCGHFENISGRPECMGWASCPCTCGQKLKKHTAENTSGSTSIWEFRLGSGWKY